MGVNPLIVAGIDLGINTPAVVSLGKNIETPWRNLHQFIGSRNDFLKVRNAISHRYRNALRNNMAQGGKGRSHVLKALDRFSEKEINFVTTYSHKLSAEILKFAVKNQVGTLHMENLSGFGKDGKSKEFVLRNWSYFKFQTMIKYKAKMAGIRVRFVNPAYTSRACCKCGNVDEANRYDLKNRSKFKCTGCGCELNADLNGAINIANSTRFVAEELDEDAVV
jgi:IS605 OrfB family transposase